MRASEDFLDSLHGLVSEALAAEIATARAKKDEHGKPVPVPVALILAAIKFLKDNGIDAPAKSQRLSPLADQLRNLDLDEVAAERLN